MIKFCPSFTYSETMTLTGKKIVAGDRISNSYILVRKQDRQRFLDLVDLIENGNFENIQELPDDKVRMAQEIERRGYFNDNTRPTALFNEYDKLAKIIYELNFKDDGRAPRNSIFLNILFFGVMLIIVAYVIATPGILSLQVDYSELSILEIVFAGVVFPFAVLILHELGHLIVAKILRISVFTARFGIFVIYPTVYISYRGININKTFNKVMLLFGGVGGHIIGLLLGVILMRTGIDGFLVQSWILANASMIYANLLPLGASDGYFMVSSIIGIFNLRLKGYKALNKWMHFQKATSVEIVCGMILIILWTIGFCGLYFSLKMIGYYFSLPNLIFIIIYSALMIFQLTKFIIKIYKFDFHKDVLKNEVDEVKEDYKKAAS